MSDTRSRAQSALARGYGMPGAAAPAIDTDGLAPAAGGGYELESIYRSLSLSLSVSLCLSVSLYFSLSVCLRPRVCLILSFSLSSGCK